MNGSERMSDKMEGGKGKRGDGELRWVNIC